MTVTTNFVQSVGGLSRGRVPLRITVSEKDHKLRLLVLYLLFFFVISTIYAVYTSPTWSYMGLYLRPDVVKIVASLIVLTLFVLVTPVMWSARTFFLNVIITSLLVPSLILYGFGGKPTSSALIVWSSVAIVYLVSGVKFKRLRLLSISPNVLMNCMIAMSVVLIAMFIALGGFRNFNVDFTKVYDFREDAANSLPGVFDYISSTFNKAIIPFGIAIALYKKNYVNVAILVVISFLMFGFTSNKIMIFTPLLVIGTFILMSRRPRFESLLGVLVAILSVILLAIVVDHDLSIRSAWGWMENIIVRRSLFMPAVLDYSYIDVFSSADKYYWSTSKFSFGLLDVPNSGIAPPELVGYIHFKGANIWANTGFIGSGFSQAGVVGTIVYSICVGLTIAYFETHGRKLGVPLVASATLGLFTTMIQSSDFAGLFLTHGLFLALVILTFVNEGNLVQPPATKRRRVRPTLMAARGSEGSRSGVAR